MQPPALHLSASDSTGPGGPLSLYALMLSICHCMLCIAPLQGCEEGQAVWMGPTKGLGSPFCGVPQRMGCRGERGRGRRLVRVGTGRGRRGEEGEGEGEGEGEAGEGGCEGRKVRGVRARGRVRRGQRAQGSSPCPAPSPLPRRARMRPRSWACSGHTSGRHGLPEYRVLFPPPLTTPPIKKPLGVSTSAVSTSPLDSELQN